MQITILGKFCLFLIFLTLWNAVNGGLNLLYMVYSALVAALVVSWLGVRLAMLLVRVEATLPDQVFADDPFPLALTIRNRGWLPIIGIAVVTSETRTVIGDIGPRAVRLYVHPEENLSLGIASDERANGWMSGVAIGRRGVMGVLTYSSGQRGSPKAGTLRLRGKGLHLHATLS